MRYTYFLLSVLIVLAGLLPIATQASDYKAGETVVITQATNENLYVAGGKIRIENKIFGDLIAAGGSVYVMDSIRDDATIFAGELTMQGVAGDDLRVFAGETRINFDVHGDLIISGGEVDIAPNVTIWGDLVIAGGEVNSEGSVKGLVKIAGGEVKLSGKIEGNVEFYAGELDLNCSVNGFSTIVAEDLNLKSNALFLKDVKYWTKDGPINFDGHLGAEAKAIFDEKLKKSNPDFDVNFKQVRQSFMLYRFFSGALLVLILVLLFGKHFQKSAGTLASDMKSYIGLGLALFLGLPIASVIAMSTVIGIPIGLIGLSFFFIVLMITNALAAVLISYEIKFHKNLNWNKGMVILVSILLFCLMRLIVFFSPFVGGLFISFITLLTCGYAIKKIINRNNTPKADQNIEVL